MPSAKKQYSDLLEPNSKLLAWDINYTLEQVSDDQFILKKYYPENNQLTHFVTFDSPKYDVKNGLYFEHYDDGTLLTKGIFVNNTKEGKWIEGVNHTGIYKNGLKQGKWITTDEQQRVIVEKQYLDGELDGKTITYDSMGVIRKEVIYKIGEQLSVTLDTSHTEKQPRFLGCETITTSEEDRKKCADKALMTFIYSKIKYPNRAAEQGLQGQALIQFVVEKDGSIGDIKTLRGISKEIKVECLRLLAAMPKWIPGEQDGLPVRVRYTLPIHFKLQ